MQTRNFLTRLSRADLESRKRPSNNKPCVVFGIGDYDHLAEDNFRNEWYIRVESEAFIGPYPNKQRAMMAWKLGGYSKKK